MTAGLEPHPIFQELTRELAIELGPDGSQRFLVERARSIQLERTDPLNFGYKPPIWHVADELLVDGKDVVLADPAWDIEDPKLQCTRPPDFLAEAVRRRELGLGPLVIMGRRELWIAGSNRSGKTEYAARKVDEIGSAKPHARTWTFSDTEENSQAKQHPVIYKYLPVAWKNLLNGKGKARSGEMKIGYGPDGFVGNKAAFPNGWKQWFKNLKQDPKDMEGDQLTVLWGDEWRDPDLLKTLRMRLGDRRGIAIITFTSIDATFTAMVNEYETGMRVVLEVEAELLPKRRPVKNLSERVAEHNKSQVHDLRSVGDPRNGGPLRQEDLRQTAQARSLIGFPDAQNPTEEIVAYEKVRRVAVAGPGSDGDQKANILYFHIADNPYYGYDPHAIYQPGDPPPLYGKEAFYASTNIRTATRTKILARAYGILTRGAEQQFNFNSAIHAIDPRRIPEEGSRYLIVDPCPGRNWFMIWVLIDPIDRWFVYREWPSYGHPDAYIQGEGEPESWALAGSRNPNNGRVVYDGLRGAAQNPFRWGYDRYKEEILRREGSEEIVDRWIDSRYAGSPVTQKEEATTMIRELEKCELYFKAAPSEQNMLTKDDGSIAKINMMLRTDDEVEIGKFSPRLARLNEPQLFVAETCPNLLFSLKEWTGKDGQHGACKDPADCLRYAILAELAYIGAGTSKWQGGGTYSGGWKR